MTKHYIRRQELADYLGVSKRTVAARVAARQIPYTRFGRLMLFRLADVEAALARNRVGAIGEQVGR